MGAAQPALTRAPDEGGLAAQYARGLLDGLGHAEPTALAACHPADAAAECGLEALTGAADGPGRICPVPIAACADGVLGALAALPGGEGLAGLRGAALLTERAAISGLARGGRVAPGGACRLLDCADGTLAVNLAREDDWGLLPAWLERAVAPDWEALADALRTVPHAVLLERAAWLGLAVAVCAPPCQVRSPFRVLQRGPAGRCGAKTPLVVDLSALWAGPLCGHLLQRMGARVLKVESLQRPDGARNGEAAFFDLLNAGKPSVALDLASARGRDQLRGLIARADIVIESARPRALAQLGIDARRCVAEVPGLTWISITGYGRDGADAGRVAYGDDAAVAGGLGWVMAAAHGEPCFVGDALADPLTGMHAGLAAWCGWLAGGGGLIDVAMRDVVAHVATSGGDRDADAFARRARAWSAHRAPRPPARAPAVRASGGAAAALGADTTAVLRELGLPC